MKKLYCIHPSEVTSKTDGDRHFIGYDQLVRLYGLDPRDCVHQDRVRPEHYSNYVHLYPRYNGDYADFVKEHE